MTDVRLIAFYLTQFHPIPENDEWWGKGFTEWTNVTKSYPLFVGHYQPHLPSDFGFYDLRVRETRRDQIALAESYGIEGFCYHYYWFSRTRLLEKPLFDILNDLESDMPFCLNWANENWTRRWDAANHEILIAQNYNEDDDLNFIKSVIPFFEDPRYIKVDGAPMLLVYRPQHLPDAAKSASVWPDYCPSIGIPKLHLCSALTHGNWDHLQFGFDSGVEFPPHNIRCENLSGDLKFYDTYAGYCPDYKDVAETCLGNHYSPEKKGFRTVVPSWDNSARRGKNGFVVLNGTPENYEFWLSQAIEKTRMDFPKSDKLVFINAWNKWAEGCHLEPDRKYGHAFLEATTRALKGSALTSWHHTGIPPECVVQPQPHQEAHAPQIYVPEPPVYVSATTKSPNKSRAQRNFRRVREFLRGRGWNNDGNRQ